MDTIYTVWYFKSQEDVEIVVIASDESEARRIAMQKLEGPVKLFRVSEFFKINEEYKKYLTLLERLMNLDRQGYGDKR